MVMVTPITITMILNVDDDNEDDDDEIILMMVTMLM